MDNNTGDPVQYPVQYPLLKGKFKNMKRGRFFSKGIEYLPLTVIF